jgi:hypothetical protein
MPIEQRENPWCPSSKTELAISDLFSAKKNESFYEEMIFKMWLIKRTHLELIETLTSLRMA